MDFLSLIFIAIALSMDSFAVSIAIGVNSKPIIRESIRIALFMAFTQALMPILGWILGDVFSSFIADYDHWIAFLLLSILGGQMIYEGLSSSDDKMCRKCVSTKTLIMLALATSIDAFIVGVGFAFLNVNILLAFVIIFIITFVFSFSGNFFSCKVGNKLGKQSEMLGGIVLILIGIKILIEHLYF
ncbi:MAG: manganese efflux pump MntP family protein [Salinivirgaceae bacterium]|nr:manganese efflux pump MntP family protein [Salinivirgaceae bacterium]MDD4748173.1 manganese efflux pump MntP family protein [Salinivirgaceae bacterium]MDY0281688.1 manganese efflux pump MntP family protein [Salinivirgaceae bacterium]